MPARRRWPRRPVVRWPGRARPVGRTAGPARYWPEQSTASDRGGVPGPGAGTPGDAAGLASGRLPGLVQWGRNCRSLPVVPGSPESRASVDRGSGPRRRVRQAQAGGSCRAGHGPSAPPGPHQYGAAHPADLLSMRTSSAPPKRSLSPKISECLHFFDLPRPAPGSGTQCPRKNFSEKLSSERPWKSIVTKRARNQKNFRPRAKGRRDPSVQTQWN